MGYGCVRLEELLFKALLIGKAELLVKLNSVSQDQSTALRHDLSAYESLLRRLLLMRALHAPWLFPALETPTSEPLSFPEG